MLDQPRYFRPLWPTSSARSHKSERPSEVALQLERCKMRDWTRSQLSGEDSRFRKATRQRTVVDVIRMKLECCKNKMYFHGPERQELFLPHPPRKGLFTVPYLNCVCVKKDRSLQPCLDYHRLDNSMVKYGSPFLVDLVSSLRAKIIRFSRNHLLNWTDGSFTAVSFNGYFISGNRLRRDPVKVQVVADGQLASLHI